MVLFSFFIEYQFLSNINSKPDVRQSMSLACSGEQISFLSVPLGRVIIYLTTVNQ